MVNHSEAENFDPVQVIYKTAALWRSSFVARTQISEFTGGLYSPQYMSNLDGKGLGIKNSFKIGRKICYPVVSVVDWLIGKLSE
jgi:hypothetical protein